jgi:hypothetical protein
VASDTKRRTAGLAACLQLAEADLELRQSESQFVQFSNVGVIELSTRASGRRSKSAKARNRGGR